MVHSINKGGKRKEMSENGRCRQAATQTAPLQSSDCADQPMAYVHSGILRCSLNAFSAAAGRVGVDARGWPRQPAWSRSTYLYCKDGTLQPMSELVRMSNKNLDTAEGAWTDFRQRDGLRATA